MTISPYLSFVGRVLLALICNFGDQNQMIHFLKNLAIAGGLLQVAAFGVDMLSLDARRTKQG